MMIEPFRHNSWATLRLLDFCREIDPGLLDATARGTYGSIGETLAHLVGMEEVLEHDRQRMLDAIYREGSTAICFNPECTVSTAPAVSAKAIKPTCQLVSEEQ